MFVSKKPETVSHESNWLTQKNKLKAAFPSLTDADLNYDQTKKNEMFKKLQAKLGKTEKELGAVLEKL
jgi:hypothetical protein